MTVGFGDFQSLCSDVPSYPWCNLFYRRLLFSPFNGTLAGNDTLTIPTTAVGVNSSCAISHINYPNIATCAVSIFFVCWLVFLCHRRKAAVGRIELRGFLIFYLITQIFQLITTGAFLDQGSTPLLVTTAIHAGFVIALFWSLLANAIVATQVVEDGTLASLIPFYGLSLLFFGLTLYISLDVGLGITNAIGGVSSPPQSLKNIPLFVLTSIWPALTAVLYFVIMSYIVIQVLNETRPMWYYILAAALFILSQLAFFLLSRVICKTSESKLDGSFVATALETAAVGVLYLAWRSITEESWDEEGQ